MTESFVFKTERPWPNNRLKFGAIVGHTTSTSTRLWLRTGQEGGFTLLVYPESIDPDNAIFEGFKKPDYELSKVPGEIRRFNINTRYENDLTTVVDIDQLEPYTVYRYALYGSYVSNTKRIVLGQDRPHRFRTLSDQDGPHSFAFYSCHMPYKATLFGGTSVVNIEMWDCFGRALSRHYDDDLSFVIAGGDQVYVDGVKTLSIWRYLNIVMCKENGKLLPTQEDMVSWYRDIYRGYWGFAGVRQVFSSYPIYMMWDDHELGDGWGSFYFRPGKKKDELRKILPALDEAGKNLTEADGHELLKRMAAAGKKVYYEYQHSHNPKTKPDHYHYAFKHGSSAFYALDGRGYRDVNRDAYRILGREQLDEFIAWLDNLDQARTRYVFVVSAVPLVHLSAALVNSDLKALVKKMGLSDDLRDSWEHNLHDKERGALLKALFKAADKGLRISILSGDVHTSAVFRIQNKSSNSVIYQLTSSAITYNIARSLGWVLGAGVPDEGKTKEGHRFERVALYTDSNFAIVKVDPIRDRVVFQLYGDQKVAAPEDLTTYTLRRDEMPITHSIAKIPLEF